MALGAALSRHALALRPRRAVARPLRAAARARWLAAATGGPARVPASRAREVQLACGALAEAVQAGDAPWFERVVASLREVLGEHAEQPPGPPPRSVADAVPVRHPAPGVAFPPVPPSALPAPAAEADEEEPAWAQALWLLEAAAAAPPEGWAGPGGVAVRGSSATDELDDQASADLGAFLASFHEGAGQHGDVDAGGGVGAGGGAGIHGAESPGMEPSWARALRLLELVPEGGPDGDGGGATAARTAGAAGGAAVEASGAAETEPSWARVLRLLEAVPRPQAAAAEAAPLPSFSEASAAGASPGSFWAAPATGSSESARKGLRMERYKELLREADGMSDVAPGASVPTGRPPPPPPAARPPPTAASAPAASAVAEPARRAAADDPLAEAVGKGNLVPAIPTPPDDEPREPGELRKEDFVWSEHEFNDGDRENRRVLRQFKKEFKQMASETPEGLRSPRLLTAALDLALACVKAYDLDKADTIYRRAVGECRRRGMPWDVKCIQDMATLRCKQNRQADAAELLEELAGIAPPHPATFINLGTVYNQLKQYDKAESWFLQAVNLKGGALGREDHWNLGICKKNMGRYEEALPMLEQALAEFQEHEPEHPVTIAKLHCSVGSCLHDMGRFEPAVEQYRKAHELYVGTVGKLSPLFCHAAEGLAKALHGLGQPAEAFEALLEAFEAHARCDAVHPTPLFEGLELAMRIHGEHPAVDLARFAPLVDAGIENLQQRGMAEDGNAGLVMSRGGKLLSRCSDGGDPLLRARAEELLGRGKELIRRSHDSGEANLIHEVMEADALLSSLRAPPLGAEFSGAHADGPAAAAPPLGSAFVG